MKRGQKFNIAQFRKKKLAVKALGKNLCKDVECKDDEICNPATGKCIKRKTAAGKRLVKIAKADKKEKKVITNMKAIKNKFKENKSVREFFELVKEKDPDSIKIELEKFGSSADGNIFRQKLFEKIVEQIPKKLYSQMIIEFLDNKELYLDEFIEVYIEKPAVKKEINVKKKQDAEKERRLDIIKKKDVEIVDPKIRPKRPRSSYLFFREHMLKKLRDEDLTAQEQNDKIAQEWKKVKKSGEISIWESKAKAAREKYEKELQAFNEARMGISEKEILKILEDFLEENDNFGDYDDLPKKAIDKLRSGKLTITQINAQLFKKFGVKDVIKIPVKKRSFNEAVDIMKKINQGKVEKQQAVVLEKDDQPVEKKEGIIKNKKGLNIDPADRAIKKTREEYIDAPWLESLLGKLDLEKGSDISSKRRIQSIVVAYAGAEKEIPESYREYFRSEVKNDKLLKGLSEITGIKAGVEWYYPSKNFYKLAYVSTHIQDSNTLKLKKVGNENSSSFYLVYVTNKMEPILQDKEIARIKNIWQRKKNLSQKENMLEVVRNNSISRNAKNIVKEYLSESLRAIAPDIGNYKIDSQFISELVEELSKKSLGDNPLTISELFNNAVNIIVYLQNPKAENFREQIVNDNYTPNELSRLSDEEMGVDIQNNNFEIQKKKIFESMTVDYYFITHPSEKIEFKIERYPFGPLPEVEEEIDENIVQEIEYREKLPEQREDLICPNLLNKLEAKVLELNQGKAIIISETSPVKQVEEVNSDFSVESESESSESESSEEEELEKKISSAESLDSSFSESESSDEEPVSEKLQKIESKHSSISGSSLSSSSDNSLSSSSDSSSVSSLSSSSGSSTTTQRKCANCGNSCGNAFSTIMVNNKGGIININFCCTECFEDYRFRKSHLKTQKNPLQI